MISKEDIKKKIEVIKARRRDVKPGVVLEGFTPAATAFGAHAFEDITFLLWVIEQKDYEIEGLWR